MAEFKVGDKVHVAFDGAIDGVFSGGRVLSVRVPERDYGSLVLASYVKLIEPEYEQAVIYTDANGDVYQYEDQAYSPCWWTIGQSGPVPFNVPRRPLAKLVPETGGK